MGFWEKFDRECKWNAICCWVWTIAIGGAVLVVLIVAYVALFPPVFTSEDAVLQRFDLSAGRDPTKSTVSYNITVILALHHHNIHRGITYAPLATSFFFNGSRFDESTVLEGFYHKPRKVVRLPLSVSAVDSPVSLGAAGLQEFEKQNVTGSFSVELRLETVMQYKGLKTRCRLIVICPLKLQVVRPEVAPSPAATNDTNCTSGEHGEHNFCPTRCYRMEEYGRHCSL
uniref:Uncharacterized protein n=1 Tax=Avena sativa TaxID=4498 RepID=A0ACD5X022_AVESA